MEDIYLKTDPENLVDDKDEPAFLNKPNPKIEINSEDEDHEFDEMQREFEE